MRFISTTSLIFIITIISIFLFYTKSETFDIININWEIIDSGGEIKKISDYSYNLTHLRGFVGDVMLVSVETFKIKKDSKLEWTTTFTIIDVVDPSGNMTYGMAETRQRILIIDSKTFSSILPFDFGFFEATSEKPLGKNELWIFWKTTTDVLLCYSCIYTIRIFINSTFFFR